MHAHLGGFEVQRTPRVRNIRTKTIFGMLFAFFAPSSLEGGHPMCLLFTSGTRWLSWGKAVSRCKLHVARLDPNRLTGPGPGLQFN